jgi:hypothetical protein
MRWWRLTTHLYLVQRLRMKGVTRTQGEPYLFTYYLHGY